MTMTSRRGFTMVELMVALVLTLMVGGVTYRLLVTNQRVTRGQTEHVSMQDNVRSGALIIGSELREVGYDRLPNPLNPVLVAVGAAGLTRSDLVAMGPDSVRYKAMRGFGVICALDAGASRITLYDDTFQSTRTLAVGDSLMLYVEDDPLSAADDVWLHAGITQLNGAQACPDGAGGTRYTIAFPLGLGAAAAFPLMLPGAPVRVFEEMVIRSYRSGGDAWLGMRAVAGGGAIQPVLGPIADGAVSPEGLALTYRDANNNVTAVPASVRTVEITLRGITDMPVHRNVQGYRATVDTLALTAQVALRNALR